MTSARIQRQSKHVYFVECLLIRNKDGLIVEEHVEILEFLNENGDSTVSTFRTLMACDLTPLDFFQWGYTKDRVLGNNPQNFAQ